MLAWFSDFVDEEAFKPRVHFLANRIYAKLKLIHRVDAEVYQPPRKRSTK